MAPIYLAIGINHKGERIPLFWGHNAEALKLRTALWQRLQDSYWLPFPEIVQVDHVSDISGKYALLEENQP